MSNAVRKPVRKKLRWSLTMTAVSAAVAVVVYLVTSNVVWAVIALFATGFLVNLVAESRANGRARWWRAGDDENARRPGS